jgi:hypothetical protein
LFSDGTDAPYQPAGWTDKTLEVAGLGPAKNSQKKITSGTYGGKLRSRSK